ncbi:MAG: hypothetical protein ACKOTA_10300, partial [Solirubrobacterales bacterium]
MALEEGAAGDLHELEPGSLSRGRGGLAAICGREALQPGEQHGLAHRLHVLLLVAQDHVEELLVDALARGGVESLDADGAIANLAAVRERT